ncbi:MAG: glycosyltransferase [Candidatus Omnitrophica bacterium]|nr:glycosyltransferase [Candidatus Omnitrophota bacterium]
MRICYFGGYDRGHPRNRMMISGLERREAQVVECHSRHPVGPLRILSLAAQVVRLKGRFDAVVVGASGHAYVPLAWLFCRMGRKPLIFDAFVSHLENWTESSGRASPAGITGWWAFTLDKISAALSDVVLFDTPEHAFYFQKAFGLPEKKVRTVPVGADPELFSKKEHSQPVPFKVLFVGSFLPLHGTEVILKASELLGKERGIEIQLVGGSNPVPYAKYLQMLHQADAALGCFGTTPKAARVIPCKVYEALAAGVPVLTADTPAARQILRHQENAILVKPGDPESLASGILLLKNDPALTQRLAAEGMRTLREIGTPEIIGQQLLSICAEAMREK